MQYRLKEPLLSKAPQITKLTVGGNYSGETQVYFDADGPVTVYQIFKAYPHLFDEVDTLSTKTQIVINLTSQYVELQKHYGFSEEAMASKISELAELICSKI